MYKKITTNIVVGRVNEALDFYEQVLGFGLVMAVPEGSEQIVTARDAHTSLAFAIIQRDDVELMLQSHESLAQDLSGLGGRPLGPSFTLYIQVADVKELYRNIKGKVTIVKDLHTTFHGAEEFWIRDGNGHVLTFAGSR